MFFYATIVKIFQNMYKRGDEIMAFADKLKALRLENNMTQEYVAERMNMARSTIAG